VTELGIAQARVFNLHPNHQPFHYRLQVSLGEQLGARVIY